jgi:hypothetical protein
LEEQAAAVQALYDAAPAGQDISEYEEREAEITEAQAQIEEASEAIME